MNMKEFDGWRASPVSVWFFEEVLHEYVRAAAAINGRAVGSTEDSIGKELMTFVKNAGVINGVEYVIDLDPFEDEREDIKDEAESYRQATASEDGL